MLIQHNIPLSPPGDNCGERDGTPPTRSSNCKPRTSCACARTAIVRVSVCRRCRPSLDCTAWRTASDLVSWRCWRSCRGGAPDPRRYQVTRMHSHSHTQCDNRFDTHFDAHSHTHSENHSHTYIHSHTCIHVTTAIIVLFHLGLPSPSPIFHPHITPSPRSSEGLRSRDGEADSESRSACKGEN